MVEHPVQTAQAFGQLARNPRQIPGMVGNALVDAATRATRGGPIGLGEVLGENLSPRAIFRPNALMGGGGMKRDIFAGPKAKTADTEALQRAYAMVSEGADDAEIWKETGWWVKTPDGVPRFEIDDSAAMYRPGGEYMRAKAQFDDEWAALEEGGILRAWMDEGKVSVGEAKEKFRAEFKRDPHEGAGQYAKYLDQSSIASKLRNHLARQMEKEKWQSSTGNVLAHEPLYDAYGDIQHTGFNVKPAKEMSLGEHGNWNGEDVNVWGGIAYNLDAGKSTTLHELQHAVQGRENMARGGSPEFMADQAITEINARLNAASKDLDAFREARIQTPIGQRAEIDRLIKETERHYRELLDERSNIDGMDLYKRLAGEAEARATQTRRDYTPDQRRTMPPWQSYDVPLNALIIKR
jgi:hypothetical protein